MTEKEFATKALNNAVFAMKKSIGAALEEMNDNLCEIVKVSQLVDGEQTKSNLTYALDNLHNDFAMDYFNHFVKLTESFAEHINEASKRF